METSIGVRARRRSWWVSPGGLLLLAGLLSSAWAWWLIAAPVATLSNGPKHVDHYGLVFVHMLGGTVMLFGGGLNLYIGATRRHFRFHRLVGRAYLICGALAASLAILLALGPAHKSDPTRLFSNTSTSLVTLGSAWLVAAGMAYRSVRNQRYDSHRDWMVRSYVLAWSFVFCRVASRVPALGELGGGEAFIWLSWVAPLLLCELGLQWADGARKAPAHS